MIRRTIREWEYMGYGEGENEIPESHADQLAAEARSSIFSGAGGQGVLEHGRKGLRARGVVGVIATPVCQLEILPKIEGTDKSKSKGRVDDATLRRRLINLIAVAYDIRIDARGVTSVDWRRDTILEVLIRLYCSKLVDAVRQGLPQQYKDHEDDLPTLRGRLDVTRQFSTLVCSPQKLACQFDARSSDIALNQVIRATIGKLSRLAQASDNLRILHELRLRYADIREVAPGALRWDRIVLDRTSTRWRELVEMAKLILDDRHQQTTAGPSGGYALLFEMNVLFEKYVGRLLARALANRTGFSVNTPARGASGNLHCLYHEKTGRFETCPDLIVKQGGKIVCILDTKWKRITDPDDSKRKRIKDLDDFKQGVDQADVYQLMAYGQLYKCDNVVLVYPHHGKLQWEPGRLREYSIAEREASKKLFVETLDITRPYDTTVNDLNSLIERCTNATSSKY